MKREDMKRAYTPTAALEARVSGVLNAIREEETVKRMNMRRAITLAACMVMLVTAAAGAAGLLFSDGYDVMRMANRALAETYGVTEEMQTFFASKVQEENGVTTVVYSGLEDMRHVLGTYTVVIEDGKAQVSWSHDGVSTEGGLDAHAWGAEQIGLMIEMVKETGGISLAYNKAHTLCGLMDGAEVTVSITKGGETEVTMLSEAESANAAVSEEAAIRIAKQAFVKEYGLTQEQLEAMIYEKDYAGYTYARVNGVAVCEVWFWLHQDENAMHMDGDGLYWARINAETGVVEMMMYDSALAGNG